ncbi:MAG: iron-containing alcohol dehydrogenase [Candidatus Hodarchaeota archaeon]
MVKKQPAWYEADMIKELMPLRGAKAMIGITSNFFSSRIYKGKTSLIQAIRYLEAILESEDRRALIITDSFTQKFAEKVTENLDLIDMEYKIWSGAIPEVPLHSIDEGAKICEEFKPKIIIAIGGGSVLDTAKMVMIKYEKPQQNLFMILPIGPLGLRKKLKYFIAIPTTSGTGSEVTQFAVISDTNRDPPKKLVVMSNELFSDITILDTDFVKDMPPFLTMATGLDALAHAVGCYISNYGTPYIDALTSTAIKEIVKYLPRAYKYGAKDIEARDHMQMASLMAGIGFGNTVAGIEHSLGHSFGKVFNLHHGLCVGLFLPYSVAFQAKVTDNWKLLCPIFNIEIENKNREDVLNEFLQALKDFLYSIDAPACIKDLKDPVISKEEFMEKLDLLAEYADDDASSLASNRSVNLTLFKKIFEYAWDGKNIDF